MVLGGVSQLHITDSASGSLYGSGHADGNRHTHTNLPLILAGAGGGLLTPGRYIQNKPAPVTNLYLSLMDRMGVTGITRHGDSTGRLANI